MSPEAIKFGRTIAMLRRRKYGMNGEAFAKACGISKGHLHNIEHGSNISLDTIVKIGNGIGLRASTLLSYLDP